jgi:hypothetical protein
MKGNSHCVWHYLILNYPLNFNMGKIGELYVFVSYYVMKLA